MATQLRRLVPSLAGVVLYATGLSACSSPPGDITARLEAGSGDAVLIIGGLSSDELASLETAGWTPEQWQAVLRVTVAGGPDDQPPVAGRYSVTGTALHFEPLFGFDAGRDYDVRIDRPAIPGSTGGGVVTTTVGLAGVDRTPTTRVTRVLPTSRVWPENLLRFYVEFSAPMSRTSGLDYVQLVDEQGQEVVDPFLPLDVEFWNGDYTRYTMFFDPGRVKRDILPNREMGRALVPGRRYAIVVRAAWRDADGQPLVEPFRQEFTVGPPDETPVAPLAWQVAVPPAGSRDALVVRFPEPLDHGLLRRAVGVRTAAGDPLAGAVVIGAGETEWRFEPESSWTAGRYDLVVLSILEDLAGNRVGRPFEVDRFDAIDDSSAPDQTLVPFTVGG